MFGREFPQASREDARALLRAATAEQRANEIECSVDVGETERERMEKASARRMARVRKIARKIGADLIENGDPRGFSFVLTCPSGRTYDWGGSGLGVPGRGFSATEIERMSR